MFSGLKATYLLMCIVMFVIVICFAKEPGHFIFFFIINSKQLFTNQQEIIGVAWGHSVSCGHVMFITVVLHYQI